MAPSNEPDVANVIPLATRSTVKRPSARVIAEELGNRGCGPNERDVILTIEYACADLLRVGKGLRPNTTFDGVAHGRRLPHSTKARSRTQPRLSRY